MATRVCSNSANQPTSDFPTTSGAWSRLNRSQNCNNAAFKFDLSSLKARMETNTVNRDMRGIRTVCIPDPIGFENLSTGGEIFHWDFGDGTTESRMDTAFVVHQYEKPGQYVVKLRAIDQGTCQVVDETSTIVTVNVAQSFVQDDADVCLGDSFRLQAGGANTYQWTCARRSIPFVTEFRNGRLRGEMVPYGLYGQAPTMSRSFSADKAVAYCFSPGHSLRHPDK